MRISDWSSDVCSSDLPHGRDQAGRGQALEEGGLTMALFELTSNDLRFVAQRLPRDVRDLLKLHHGKLFLGGGFIRAVEIGRASCRERVCQYVEISVVAVSLKKKQINYNRENNKQRSHT